MHKLVREVQATLIHGTTGFEILTGCLPAGTVYSNEWANPFERDDPETLQEQHSTLLVEGYRYRVATRDLKQAAG